MNDVTLIVNDVPFQFWQDVAITRTMESIADSFQIKVTDKWDGEGEQTPITAQSECILKLDDDRILTGYIDAVSPSYDARSHSFSIRGRSKTADLVDCSIIGQSQLSRITLTNLVNILGKPFGIETSADSDSVSDEVIDKVAIEQSETVHENLRRYANQVAALMTADEYGNVVIRRVGRTSTKTILLQDPGGRRSNILKGTANFDDAKRYSSYSGKSQTSSVPFFSDGETDAKQDAEIKSSPIVDKGVVRYRPLLIITENATNTVQTNKRVEWEMANRVGQSFSITVTVQGWRDNAGELWAPNKRVRCVSKILRQNGDEWLVISSVTYRKSLNGGTTTDITLKRVDAFVPEPEKTDKSNATEDFLAGTGIEVNA